jgi:ApbE superfamily uncharacterized protein (UPF0280 family)
MSSSPSTTSCIRAPFVHTFGGDDRAVKIMDAATGLVMEISRRLDTDRPVLCGCCSSGITDGSFSLALAFPETAEVEDVLATAICFECGGPEKDEVAARAVAGFAEIWPGIRLVAHVRH